MWGKFERLVRLLASQVADHVRAALYPEIARVDARVFGVAGRIETLSSRADQDVAAGIARTEGVKEAMRDDFRRLDERLNGLVTKVDALTRRIDDSLAASRGVSAQVAAVLPTVERIRRELEFVRHYRSNYLGDGVSIAWLPDDTIMFLNANDDGGPSALVSGGRYEESNFAVFFSFLRESSLVLDIGANLGVYALRTAQHFRNTQGRVIAFEPHPLVTTLFKRSIEHNGLKRQIEIREVALADRAGDATFYYPPAHLGQGGNSTAAEGWVPLAVRLEVADDLFPDEVFDLVKIDVEGNEFSVLRGMRGIIARSPDIAILFEKLYAADGEAAAQFNLLNDLGLTIYSIDGDARLRALDLDAYLSYSGYLLAARAGVVGDALDRRFFHIGWRQLSFLSPPQPAADGAAKVSAAPGEALFYGPYGYLPKGRYRLNVVGRLEGPMTVAITEQFGVEVRKLAIDPGTLMAEFEIPYDLRKFECVGRAGERAANIAISGLRLQRF